MDYHGDNRSNIKTLEISLLSYIPHIYAKNEQFGIIEGSICTINELSRATWHAVLFKTYTSIITISLVELVVDLLNRFLSKDRVSDTLTPSIIVELIPKLDKEQKIYSFWFIYDV